MNVFTQTRFDTEAKGNSKVNGQFKLYTTVFQFFFFFLISVTFIFFGYTDAYTDTQDDMKHYLQVLFKFTLNGYLFWTKRFYERIYQFPCIKTT